MNSLRNDGQSHRRPVGVDLFAGAGGLSLGFEQAGFDVRAAIEIDPIHCAVHEFNFPDCASICANASELSSEHIRKVAKLGNTPVDVVFGGAPCQGFSLIGKRALDDPRNRLLLEFLRLTVELNAAYFVFENVKGLTIGEHKKLLEELVAAFHESGYEIVVPYRVLNAVDFGVPQDRRRLFLIGARKGLPLPAYPSEAGSAKPTVWEAIGDLPEASEYEELRYNDSTNRADFGSPSAYAGKLRESLVDETDFSHPRAWDRGILTSSMLTEHTAVSQRRFRDTKHGYVEPVSRFLKLNPGGVCNTLRAGTGSDKGAFTSPRPIHPTTPRCITVREAARLHSYPDWFRFHATKWHGFRQIGNSVPPLLGRAVAAQVIGAMGIVPKKPTAAIDLGPESLLQMVPAGAARYYGVPERIAGRRLRVADRPTTEQLAFSPA